MGIFQSVPVDLTDRLEDPGESWTLSGALEPGSYTVGERELTLPGGLSYDVVLTNAGDGILLTGMVRGSATAPCDRCLDETSFEIAGEIEEYYLFEEPEDPEAFDDGFELLPADRVIDLAAPLSDAVVMDTPFVVLCREDCKGLCPGCGANLNREACSCDRSAAHVRPDNPFAVLKDLDLR